MATAKVPDWRASTFRVLTLADARRRSVPVASPAEDPWDVFELDEEALEPEPEYGDFWGELDDDCDNGGG